MLDHLVARLRLATLIVIWLKKLGVFSPVLLGNLLDRHLLTASRDVLVAIRENGEPKACPGPVLFADVVRSVRRTPRKWKALVSIGFPRTSNPWGFRSIQHRSSPPRGQCSCRRHRTGETLETILEVRDALGVGRDDSDRVEGVTKKLFPRIMLRSPSPSEAAPKSGASSEYMVFTNSSA